jgi:hypothetical protein
MIFSIKIFVGKHLSRVLLFLQPKTLEQPSVLPGLQPMPGQQLARLPYQHNRHVKKGTSEVLKKLEPRKLGRR